MSNIRNKTVKAIGWGAGSTIIIQAFGVVISIILARLLDPEDFGLIAAVAAFTGFAGIINDLGLSGALIQRKNIAEGHKSSVFWINVFNGLALMLLFFVLAPLVGQFYDDQRLVTVTRIFALNFMISSLSLVQVSLVKRRIDFKTISKIRMIAYLLSGLISVAMAMYGFGYWALVAQIILVNFFSAFMYWFVSDWRPKFIFEKASVKDLYSFGVNVSLLRIINYIGNELDVLLMGKYMGQATLGLYNQSRKFQILPFTAIKSQISNVLFPTLSQLQDDKPQQAAIYIKLTGLLSLLIFPVLMGLFAVSEEFVMVVLTEKWAATIPMIQIFSVCYLFAAIGFPVMTFNANNRTRELLNISIPLRILRVIIVVLAVLKGDVMYVVVGVGATLIIDQLVLNYFAARIMGIPIWTIVKGVFPLMLASFAMAGVVVGADYLFMDQISDLLQLVLKTLIGIIFYMGYLFIFRPNPLPFIMKHYWPPKMNSLKSFLR